MHTESPKYSIAQTNCSETIKSILSVDNMYDKLVYDYSPKLDEYEPDVKNQVWFILYHNGYKAGLITLQYLNYTLWVPHIVIFKRYRGDGSEMWGKLVAAEMRKKYGAKRFLALTPYKSAQKYAEKIGFRNICVLEKSIQKNGVLFDQYMLEME